MTGFTVIDFETTGFSPRQGDRVIELGVVYVSEYGEVEGEWTTLLNPDRGMGATHIHGISAADVVDAPRFADVAHHVVNAAAGRTLVAHNAQFDMRFLFHELDRAGYTLDWMPIALCSMKWSGRLIGAAKLSHACEAVGIATNNAHNALGDARATAALLKYLLRYGGGHAEFLDDVQRPRSFPWPIVDMTQPGPAVMHRSHEPKAPDAWLDKLLDAAFIPGADENEAAYMLVLERALLDHQISTTEGHQLVETARDAGLSVERAQELHYRYIDELATQAWADGELTSQEQDALRGVASALRISDSELAEIVGMRASEPVDPAGQHIGEEKTFLQVGDRVVFTGETTTRSRDDWVAVCARVGLSVGGVTKKTRVVIADDGDTMTGKAKKARDYGVPIVNETTFVRMFEALSAQVTSAPDPTVARLA